MLMKDAASEGGLELPRITPAQTPLRFPFNIFKLLTNNVEIVPEQAYYDNVVMAPGPPRMVFITGAEAIKTVIHKRHADFPKGRLQIDVLEPLFGNAMIQCHGQEWRWQRAAAAPLFRHSELLSYTRIMYEAAAATIADWKQASPGRVRLINQDILRAAFAVVSRTMLVGGADNVIEAIQKGHTEYFRQVNWWVAYKMFCLPHWLPRPGGAAMKRHEQRVREAVRQLVNDRRHTAHGDDDLLGRMLAAKDPETSNAMEDERIVNNIVAFLVAGYDTTALAVIWALYLLSLYPEWANRIRDEVQAVAGEAPIGAEHLDGLVVVKQVINETLRLYPTAPVIVRDINEELELEGIHIPAGTIGIIPIYTIHRHRGIWQNPDRFDPGRFAPEAKSKPNKYQFLPFGAGPRICIGAAFAMMEATILLASFIRAADFTLVPGFVPKPTGQIFLTTGGDIPMQVSIQE
jgi:cytochrome P450